MCHLTTPCASRSQRVVVGAGYHPRETTVRGVDGQNVTAVHALGEGTAVVEVANATAAPGCSPPSAASPRVDTSAMLDLDDVEWIVAGDVTNPLLTPTDRSGGATAVGASMLPKQPEDAGGGPGRALLAARRSTVDQSRPKWSRCRISLRRAIQPRESRAILKT